MSCESGEIKGLIGRNGSGKSTLLKIIFGTEKAESKFVRIGSKIIKNVSDGRNRLNYLPQDNFIPNNVSIKTVISLFLDQESRNILFENNYIKPLLNKKNEHLSGGEKRIIEILLMVHSKAEFVLLDEPFNGLSPILKDYIIEYIKKIKSSKGFIITDHDYENVISLADNIVYLQNGFIREITDTEELVGLGYMTQTTYDSIYN
jgi:ABC-type multidrug transport system ATPase subunit